MLTLVFMFTMSCKTEIKKEEMPNNKISLNFPVKYSQELNSKLKTSFWKCNDDSRNNSTLHYYLEIPNNVKPTRLDEKNIRGIDTIKEIASYKRIDESPYLEVQVIYQTLNHEINPSDWLYNLLNITNEKIVEKRELKGKSGVFLDALTSKEFPNGETVISRSTAQKNYDASTNSAVIVSVKVSCNIKDYPELAEEIMAIATGWNFIHKSDYALSENLKRYDTQKKNELSFYFPASWEGGRFAALENEPNRFAIFNKNEKNETKGAINIFVSKEQNNQDQLFEDVINRFKTSTIQIDIAELKQADRDFQNDYYNKTWESVGSIKDPNQNFDGIIKTTVVQTLDEFILIELVGPHKQLDYYNAARNDRAFDLVLQTLQTSHKTEKGLDHSVSTNEEEKKDEGFFKKLFG